MSCVGESTPSSDHARPERLHDDGPEDRAGIVPMPPANEVPPMTAALITSSSFVTPSPVTAALSRAVCTTALTPPAPP